MTGQNLASLRQQLAEAKKDAERMRFGLENCRLLAARHRKEDWALLILGFCAEAGVAESVTREIVNQVGKESQAVRDSMLNGEE